MAAERFTSLWAYRVRPEAMRQFCEEYGPAGRWVVLFRRAKGYVSTALYQDRTDPHRFITVDTWETEMAFREFRRRYAAEYADLDRVCEALTLDEEPLGEFRAVP